MAAATQGTSYAAAVTNPSSKPVLNVRTQRSLRSMPGKVQTTADKTVNQCPDDLGSTHGLCRAPSELRRHSIEANNLPLEQDNRHFSPSFSMNDWSAAWDLNVRAWGYVTRGSF